MIRRAMIAALLLIATSANATLISMDWHNSGDGLITRDTSTGLEWLDMSVTGVGHAAAKAQLNGEFQSFRFASPAELFGLFQSGVAGLTSTFQSGVDAGLTAAFIALAEQIGFDYENEFQINTCDFALGCELDSFGGDGLHRTLLNLHPDESRYTFWLDNDTDQVSIQALVRVVPEPATVVLFGAGLLMLGFAVTKRAKQDLKLSSPPRA